MLWKIIAQTVAFSLEIPSPLILADVFQSYITELFRIYKILRTIRVWTFKCSENPDKQILSQIQNLPELHKQTSAGRLSLQFTRYAKL